MGQDGPLELLQGRARLEAKVVSQSAPSLAIDLQRLGLTASAVKGEHQLAAQALAERMLSDELVELLEDVVLAPHGEVGLDSLFQRGEVEVLEARDLLLRERVVGEVDERRAAPQAKARGAFSGVVGSPAANASLPSSSRCRNRSTSRCPGSTIEHVAVAVGYEDPVARDCEGLAKPRDVRLDDLRGARRLLLRPQAVDKPVARYDLVRMDE